MHNHQDSPHKPICTCVISPEMCPCVCYFCNEARHAPSTPLPMGGNDATPLPVGGNDATPPTFGRGWVTGF